MTLTVRMYDVGFGDCFLVMSTGDVSWRLLIDCGKHLSSTPSFGGTISDAVRGLIDDCRDPDGVARIDVVVMSHRHFDHIAGFDLPDWASVEVREVWLPWTEDPDDPEAARIHDAQLGLALRLQALAEDDRELEAARELLELNALSNAGAMRTLHERLAGPRVPRYLAGDIEAAARETSALPGVKVHVLGPARDEATIRDLDPPKGQSFLDLPGRPGGGEPPLLPFGPVGRPLLPSERTPAIEKLEAALDDDLFDLAAALEDSVNGTSLVLLVEVGRARLLFGGDAQWGTWDRILRHEPWRRLVAGSTFLKVGHHGSHNASPKHLVDDVLPDGIIAMVSVRPIERWPGIPKAELLARLIAKGMHVVRSDTGPDRPLDGLREGPGKRYVEIDLVT